VAARALGHLGELAQLFLMEPPLRCLVEKRLPHRPKGRKSGLIVNVIAVQFSSFGSLFTTFSNYSSSQPERLPEEVAAGLVQTVSAAGFVYVPEEARKRVGCQNSVRTSRKPRFAGTMPILAPIATLDVLELCGS
jgi:hypothetical protein